jgi:hypothetical protein
VFVTTHVAVAAPLGRGVPPPAAAALGVASHALLDALPHWGVADRFTSGDDRRRFLAAAVVDGLAAGAVTTALVGLAPPSRRSGVVAAVAGGVLLDLNKPCHELLGRSPFPPAVDRWHRAIQRERDTRGRLVGEAVAAAVTAVVAAWVVRRQPSSVPRSSRRRSLRTHRPRRPSPFPHLAVDGAPKARVGARADHPPPTLPGRTDEDGP